MKVLVPLIPIMLILICKGGVIIGYFAKNKGFLITAMVVQRTKPTSLIKFGKPTLTTKSLFMALTQMTLSLKMD